MNYSHLETSQDNDCDKDKFEDRIISHEHFLKRKLHNNTTIVENKPQNNDIYQGSTLQNDTQYDQ